MKIPLHWVALLSVTILAPVAAEAALRFYVSVFSRPARLFRSDAQTGWSNAPNIVTTRINAAGEEWSISTDENGQRLIAQESRADRTILILGDSLSFGEGINIEDRFDVKMLSHFPARVINTGTMGYGTDQEYVVFRKWKHVLKTSDILLIVLNKSDYLDVLRQRFFGRAKPYVEKAGDSYIIRPARIGLLERWSDRSLVARVATRFIDPTIPENVDPSQSIGIISFILGRIREEVPRGVKVVLAHQGTQDFLGPKLGLSSTIFCKFADVCIDLDDALAASPSHLLPDGHWSASGHMAVAQTLLKALQD
ncbi:hypothetical protein [Bradyrhizobium erythrophlei]|uniref:GDSL-like Lipase/Acylhydrolase family protein n=1 Tax=Bradyrhizobium erythrophlei TaxID=1437360 RepID=A0A1M7SR25_9BRAD|nr:hypothetical protein [Bradyrhizobium erythrophlei]SHN60901.1 hypothetical protein SAMN05444170_0052 [Bradyrhizobium erythrophlei]